MSRALDIRRRIARWAAPGIALAALLCARPSSAFERPELVALLEAERAEQEMPGLRAAVRFPGGAIVRAAVGVADKKAGTPLDDDLGMPGGSTGKTFVAALALLLVEDGTLSLDAPVARWLGEERWYARLPNAEAIRVRHLLAHTSGLRDYVETVRFHWAMIRRVLRRGSARFEPEELIGFVRRKKPRFQPGDGFHYSDPGYLVLGRVLEAASGVPYYVLLEERILGPLKLDGVRPQDRSVLEGIAPGYLGGASNLKKDGRMKFDPSSEWTGGGLVTTPTMLAEFYGALAEGRVLRPETLDLMLSSGWRGDPERGWHYGFGVFVADRRSGEGAGGASAFSHGGLWPGYRTHVRHDLETGTTIAVQTNRQGRLDLAGLVARIAERLEVGAVRPAEDPTVGAAARGRAPSAARKRRGRSARRPAGRSRGELR